MQPSETTLKQLEAEIEMAERHMGVVGRAYALALSGSRGNWDDKPCVKWLMEEEQAARDALDDLCAVRKERLGAKPRESANPYAQAPEYTVEDMPRMMGLRALLGQHELAGATAQEDHQKEALKQEMQRPLPMSQDFAQYLQNKK